MCRNPGWCALVLLAACGRVGFDVHGDAGAPTADDAEDADGAGEAGAVAVCDLATEPDVVALYGFEPALGADVTGQHPGVVVDTVTATTGRCGATAAGFGSGYVRVAASPAFDLATGSVELFVRTPAPSGSGSQTLFARDASEFGSEGHVTMYRIPSGELILRVQRGGVSYYRCAPPWPADTWIHVGMSFGGTAQQGLRLWIDHVEATQATATLDTGDVSCLGILPAGGLSGNTNTLLLGASNAQAADGDPAPIGDQFLLGELDQIRIRSTWRDFSAP